MFRNTHKRLAVISLALKIMLALVVATTALAKGPVRASASAGPCPDDHFAISAQNYDRLDRELWRAQFESPYYQGGPVQPIEQYIGDSERVDNNSNLLICVKFFKNSGNNSNNFSDGFWIHFNDDRNKGE